MDDMSAFIATILSLMSFVLEYAPVISGKFKTLEPGQKQVVNVGIIVAVVVSVYLLSTFVPDINWFSNGFTGFYEMLQLLLVSVAGNQGVHTATNKIQGSLSDKTGV